jgi:hypothetical protein
VNLIPAEDSIMVKKRSRREQSQSFNKLQVGGLLIVVGPVAAMLTGLIMPATSNTAEARGQAFGRGLVAVLCVIAGIVLIVMHFARNRSR